MTDRDTDDDQDRPVGVSFRIPRELHREMKIFCVERDLTMKDILISGYEALKEAEKSGGDQLKLFSRLPTKGSRT